jgi:hypothetical protein
MRLSSYLSNGEVALAALCGLMLAPILWVVIVALRVLVEVMG